MRDELAEIPDAVPDVVERLPALPAPSEPSAPAADINAPELYIHRELSQLQFNIRVLEQALDESYPLLERL
ncbi:MAG: hypothetical protein Q7I95_07255, partial [Thiobacillus sp.]|nr:hypothetical protein [Thiobacillus sp.]